MLFACMGLYSREVRSRRRYWLVSVIEICRVFLRKPLGVILV